MSGLNSEHTPTIIGLSIITNKTVGHEKQKNNKRTPKLTVDVFNHFDRLKCEYYRKKTVQIQYLNVTMFCTIMFSVLEALVTGVSEWCGTRLSTLTKCWIWFTFILTVYIVVFVLAKSCLCVYKYFAENNFKELYEAAQSNDMVTLISILKRRPNYVNKFKYPEGYTPFMVACAKANTQMVKFMLKIGANVALKSKSNETPFYLAAFYYIQNKNCKNATCIRELYYAGANIDEPGKNNVTPLQMAAIFGHTSLIKWLLLKNANMKICPHPYLLAKSQGHHEAANLIACSMQIKSIQY